jgi:hypothetical protein
MKNPVNHRGRVPESDRQGAGAPDQGRLILRFREHYLDQYTYVHYSDVPFLRLPLSVSGEVAALAA